MSRRKSAVKRIVPPDPRYDSQTVSKFVSNMMFEGKKSLAFALRFRAPDRTLTEEDTSAARDAAVALAAERTGAVQRA